MNKREIQQRFQAIKSVVSAEFPDTQEGRLFAAIVIQAIEDVMITNSKGGEERDRVSAFRYLAGDMWHAGKAGVDPDWVRLILFRVGFPDDTCIESRRKHNNAQSKAEARCSRLLAKAMGCSGQERVTAIRLS